MASNVMMSDWQFVWIKAVAKAWSDSSFEADLRSDPRGALDKAFQFKFPDDMDLKVVPPGGPTSHPGNENAMTLVLPPKPPTVDQQPVALAGVVETTARHCCGQPCC